MTEDLTTMSPAPDPDAERRRDAALLQKVAHELRSVIQAIDHAAELVRSGSRALNGSRASSELLAHGHELTALYETVQEAASVLQNDEPIGGPSSYMPLNGRFSPHQLETLAQVARRSKQPPARPSDIYGAHPLQAQYERSLRRELAGNEVGAATFWAAVDATTCTLCGAGPGTTCQTPAGHSVNDDYHSPRRKDAATNLRR